MTNTEYVTTILKSCGIREHIISNCQGTRSSVQVLRDRIEELVVEIREDDGPQTYCEPDPLVSHRPKRLSLACD